MNLFYTLEEGNIREKNSIFLAGPTHRIHKSNIIPRSWRKDAIDIFNQFKCEADILIPEYRYDVRPEGWTYEKQISWETKMLKKAGVILFWIPRSVELPALTTNIEFGEYLHSGKIVCGGPKNALHNRYLITRFEELNKKWFYTLQEVVQESMKFYK